MFNSLKFINVSSTIFEDNQFLDYTQAVQLKSYTSSPTPVKIFLITENHSHIL